MIWTCIGGIHGGLIPIVSLRLLGRVSAYSYIKVLEEGFPDFFGRIGREEGLLIHAG